MNLILKVAFLQMCEGCQKHGQIVLPDGTRSKSFMTQTAALGELKSFEEQGLVSADESRVVRESIVNSTLIEHSPLVDELYREYVDSMLVPIGLGASSRLPICLN